MPKIAWLLELLQGSKGFKETAHLVNKMHFVLRETVGVKEILKLNNSNHSSYEDDSPTSNGDIYGEDAKKLSSGNDHQGVTGLKSPDSGVNVSI